MSLALAFKKLSSNSSIVAKAIEFNKASAMASKPRKPKMRELTIEPYFCDSMVSGKYVETACDGVEWVSDTQDYKRALAKFRQWERDYKASKEAWGKYKREMREWRKKFPLEAL